MPAICSHKTSRFTVHSFFNGGAYSVVRQRDQAELFFQDDGASVIRDEWDAMQDANPERDADDVLEDLLLDYWSDTVSAV